MINLTSSCLKNQIMSLRIKRNFNQRGFHSFITTGYGPNQQDCYYARFPSYTFCIFTLLLKQKVPCQLKWIKKGLLLPYEKQSLSDTLI